MSLVLQSSGGGQITIQEPATASNFTATLPATTGTLVVTGTTPTLNGITFPATQVPSADANTLDDYEEGTFTPNLGGNTTYSVQSGNYIKVGRMVYAELIIAVTSIGTGATGQIFGLPFSSTSDTPIGGVSVAYWAGSNTAVTFMGGYKNAGDASVLLIGTTAATINAINAPSIFKDGTSVYASVVYRSVS